MGYLVDADWIISFLNGRPPLVSRDQHFTRIPELKLYPGI
jgi:hypothetical protein